MVGEVVIAQPVIVEVEAVAAVIAMPHQES